jgi:glycosyltransferase involved in cell wall biosynthesis
MTRHPLVSVVLPVRNGIPFLAFSVRSILAQTLETIELVIVDDNSSDSTRAEASHFAKLDGRVKYVPSAGDGIVAALQTGVEASRAPFLARMDHDDVALPQRLELQRSLLEAHPELGLVGGWIDLMDAQGRQFSTIEYPIHDREIQTRLASEVCFASPTMMMPYDALISVGGFRQQFEPAEDVDLALRISEKYHVANVNKSVLRYRVHGGNISVTSIHRQIEAVVRAREDHLERRRLREGRPSLAADRSPSAPIPASLDVQSMTLAALLTWMRLLARAGIPAAARRLLADAERLARSAGAPGSWVLDVATVARECGLADRQSLVGMGGSWDRSR